MKDLFLEYETLDGILMEKQDILNKLKLYNMDIIDGFFSNILEAQKGNDLLCLDYMDFTEYIKMISQEFNKMFKNYSKEITNLETEIDDISKSLADLALKIFSCSKISITTFLEILKLLNISYQVINDDNITINILNDNKVFPIIFNNGQISLVKIQHNIKISFPFENIIDNEFIIFYINFIYNNGSNYSIEDIYFAYKNTCLNRQFMIY